MHPSIWSFIQSRLQDDAQLLNKHAAALIKRTPAEYFGHDQITAEMNGTPTCTTTWPWHVLMDGRGKMYKSDEIIDALHFSV